MSQGQVYEIYAREVGHGSMFGFIEMLFFLAVLTLGLVYVWRKGGLEWD